MTPRQQIKNLLSSTARRYRDNKSAYRQSAMSTLGCLENPILIAELDRIENFPLGIIKLVSEAWNDFHKERDQL